MGEMVRMVRRISRMAWLGFFGFCLQACSTGDTGTDVVQAPQNLKIDHVETLGSVVAASGGYLALGCSEPLLVWVEPYDRTTDKLGDFTLAPPGNCAVTNCGWMVLIPNDTIDRAVRAVSSPIELDLPAAERTKGSLNLRLELRDSWGDPVQTHAGKTFAAEFDVALRTDLVCP